MWPLTENLRCREKTLSVTFSIMDVILKIELYSFFIEETKKRRKKLEWDSNPGPWGLG